MKMRKFGLHALRCPIDGEELSIKREEKWDGDELIEGKLLCACGHEWNVSEGLPSLVNMDEVSEEDIKWIRQYDEHAEEYDEKIRIYDVFLKTDMTKEREQLMAMVPIEEGSRIVDISIGTAANFMAMKKVYPSKMGKVFLYGIELSRGMLKVARRKLRAKGLNSVLVHADVNKGYPFPDDYFDAVIHTGGINTFSDIPRAFSEMLRICKPNGIVLVSDEGLSPTQEKTEFGQWVISQNRLFKCKPPLDKVPKNAREPKHWWIMNNTFYVITFRKQ